MRHESPQDRIFAVLKEIRRGNGVAESILKHGKKVFALLGVETTEEAIQEITAASRRVPPSRDLRAALNALYLTGPIGPNLTRRREDLMATLAAEESAKPEEQRSYIPATVPGIIPWEDRGLRSIAGKLAERTAPEDPYLAIGRLNRQVLNLQHELAKAQATSEYRDEKLKAALSETTSIIHRLLDKRDDVRTLELLRRLQALYDGAPGTGRRLDLSGNPRASLFGETLPTTLIPVIPPGFAEALRKDPEAESETAKS